VGFTDSVDIIYAKQVASMYDTDHHSIIITVDEYLQCVEKIIINIEKHDSNNVRKAVLLYLAMSYINKSYPTTINSVLSGSGFNEITGLSYKYNEYDIFNPLEYDFNCKTILSEISNNDALINYKVSKLNKIFILSPFLSNDFIHFYLSIPIKIRCTKVNDISFMHNYLRNTSDIILPSFSFERGSLSLDSMCENILSSELFIINNTNDMINKPELSRNSNEQEFYTYIYEKYF
jgi:asparagine synthetase B (glutamine-hydrolysing)